MEHKGSAGIQDSVSCGLLACSVAATKGWPISRNCGVAGLTCMLILRREELLILSSNSGKPDTQATTLLSPTDAVNGAFRHANPATP